MERDYGQLMVWFLSEMTGPPLPPYLLEIVMKDGRSFFVHSGIQRDEDTNSVVVNVWDLRGVDEHIEKEIKQRLDDPKSWNEANSDSPQNLHPALSLGRLRCSLDDILYVVEWWTRVWNLENYLPKEKARNIGFVKSKDK